MEKTTIDEVPLGSEIGLYINRVGEIVILEEDAANDANEQPRYIKAYLIGWRYVDDEVEYMIGLDENLSRIPAAAYRINTKQQPKGFKDWSQEAMDRSTHRIYFDMNSSEVVLLREARHGRIQSILPSGRLDMSDWRSWVAATRQNCPEECPHCRVPRNPTTGRYVCGYH